MFRIIKIVILSLLVVFFYPHSVLYSKIIEPESRIQVVYVNKINSLGGEWFFLPSEEYRYQEEIKSDSVQYKIGITESWPFHEALSLYQGNVWFIKNIFVSEKSDLAVFLPLHYRDIQLFCNGKLIYESQKSKDEATIDPAAGKPDIAWISSELIRIGINEIAIKTAPLNNMCGFSRDIQVGNVEKIKSLYNYQSIWYISIAASLLFLSLFFFMLFLKRRSDKFYFYYSVMSFSLGIWILGYKGYALWLFDNQAVYIICTYINLLFLLYVAMIMFIHSFFAEKINWFTLFLIVFYFLLGFFISFEYAITGNIVIFNKYLYGFYMKSVSIVVFYGIYLVIKAVKKKIAYSRQILLGISVQGIAVIIGILRFINVLSIEPYIIESFFLMTLIFSYVLASRYARVHTDLEKAHDELLVLDKMKDDFLATTSHELRTPLHGIMGLSESLMKGVHGPVTSAQKENLSLIYREASHLSGMVGDILDFSKLRAGKADLLLQRVNLGEVVSTVVSLLIPEAEKKGLSLKVETSDSLIIIADRNRIRQVLINLVGNAIKFSEKGTVTVSVRPNAGGGACITVRDEGPGIAGKDLERIWNPFIQAADPDTRRAGGTGLGLPITKYLVELHGGSIRVESEKGRGSAFIVELSADPISRGIMMPVIEAEKRVALALKDEILKSQAEESMAEVTTFTPARILAVDDDEVNLKVLEGFCAVAGYELIAATNGSDALKIINSYKIDLVLLDLMLPGMSGYEVCRIIRQSMKHDTLPIIMVTARDITADMVRGFISGANDYITKPFARDELLVRIENQLAIKQMLEIERSLLKELKANSDSVDGPYKRSLDLKQMTFQLLAWERVIRDDMEIARAFQERLMTYHRTIPGLESYVHYQPVIHLGGDIYDVIAVRPGILRIFLADATGHGISASLNTVKILSEYAAVKETMHSPELVLNYLSRRFIDLYRDYQIVFTCIIADIDVGEGKLSLVSAGHPEAYLLSNGEVRAIKPRGPIVGLTEHFVYHPAVIPFNAGDVFFLYTDGLLELIDSQYRRAAGPNFDESNILKERIASLDISLPLEQLCASLMVSKDGSAKGRRNDDITVVALRKK